MPVSLFVNTTMPEAVSGSPRHEEHPGQRREGEAQAREQKRRQFVQADLDDDEIGAPDKDNRQGQQQLGKRHGTRAGNGRAS